MKPSKAAMELCKKLKLMQREEINGWRTGPWHPKPDALAIIDAFMADLLRKAEDCAHAGRNDFLESQHDLINALEPWKENS